MVLTGGGRCALSGAGFMPTAYASHLLRPPTASAILNYMVQYATAELDDAFAALADGTRRGVLEELGRAERSITELAVRFGMTLTGMRKHVAVLESAGLVETRKVGRVRTCRIGRRRLDEVAAWIDIYQRRWDARFDELDQVVAELVVAELTDKEQRDAQQQ